jgi:hypothetical protein
LSSKKLIKSSILNTLIQCSPNFLERKILTVCKGNFDSLKRKFFDSLKRKFLTVWKGNFWQFEKGNFWQFEKEIFDSLKKEILTVWKGKLLTVSRTSKFSRHTVRGLLLTHITPLKIIKDNKFPTKKNHVWKLKCMLFLFFHFNVFSFKKKNLLSKQKNF